MLPYHRLQLQGNVITAVSYILLCLLTCTSQQLVLVCCLQLSGKDDHHYFGRPEHATNPRPVYIADSSTGGADLVGEYAAAYAAGAVLFKSVGHGDYAATLYKHAQQAFAFA